MSPCPHVPLPLPRRCRTSSEPSAQSWSPSHFHLPAMQRPLAHENSLSEQGRGAGDREHGVCPERGDTQAARAGGVPGGAQADTDTRPVALRTGGYGQSRGSSQRGTAGTTSQPLPTPLQGSRLPAGVLGGTVAVPQVTHCAQGSTSPTAAHPGCPPGRRSCSGALAEPCPHLPSQGMGTDTPSQLTGTASAKSRRTALDSESRSQPAWDGSRDPSPPHGPGVLGHRDPPVTARDCGGRGGRGVSRWSGESHGGDGFWSQVQAMHGPCGAAGSDPPHCGSVEGDAGADAQ